MDNILNCMSEHENIESKNKKKSEALLECVHFLYLKNKLYNRNKKLNFTNTLFLVAASIIK